MATSTTGPPTACARRTAIDDLPLRAPPVRKVIGTCGNLPRPVDEAACSVGGSAYRARRAPAGGSGARAGGGREGERCTGRELAWRSPLPWRRSWSRSDVRSPRTSAVRACT
ncbi:hypothetical protein [Ornithinimicrobium kibberense]|uniref:hypothetical protein n=1 Tax=Ornithinimicrobium kibberense TaxID=282060 RepID=UPI00361803D1